MEPNDLLFLLTQAGGVDEGVWYQLQRMHDHHMETQQNNCPSAASSSSRYSDSNDHLIRSLSCSTELDTTFEAANPQPYISLDIRRSHKTGQETTTTTTRTASRNGKSLELSALSTALSDGNDTLQSSGGSGRNVRCTTNSMTEAVGAANGLISNDLTGCLNSPSDKFGRAVMKQLLSVKSAAGCTSSGVAESGHSLGKRLVRYTDVWDEEDFIFKSNQENSLSALYDWSSLVRSYSDTHDGMYLDWNIQHLRNISCAVKKEMKTIKKPTQNCKSYTDSEIISEKNSVGFSVRAPPVPVSMIHPSCWSINARKVARETSDMVTFKNSVIDCNINGGKVHGVFDVIHPGSLSSAIVELPGTAADRDGMSDIDDFTLHAEIMTREMHALEAANYMRLKSLSSSLINASNIEEIRKKRIRLADTLTLLYQRNEYENLTSDRLTYGTVPAPHWAPSKGLNCPDSSTASAACTNKSESNTVDLSKKVQCDSLNEGESRTTEPIFTLAKQTRCVFPAIYQSVMTSYFHLYYTFIFYSPTLKYLDLNYVFLRCSHYRSRYGTRCAASAASIAVSTAPLVKEKTERYQLGSCLLNHIPHGGYVSGLSKGVRNHHKYESTDTPWSAFPNAADMKT